MKRQLFLVILLFSSSLSQSVFAWGRHDILTQHALHDVAWVDKYNAIKVTPFKSFVKKAFSQSFTTEDFFAQYQLNPKTKMPFFDPMKLNKSNYAKPGEITSAKQILKNYVDEPDWGMDENLNFASYQKYMGGTTGPTSKAFRHMYFKKWSMRAPLRTFHFPIGEMGEPLKRSQVFYILAEDAFKVSEPYWAFRFLAWSLHYIQDLSQPFHSSQLLTPKFVSWPDLFNFKKFVQRTTQIIGNYHFLYECYIAHRMLKESDPKRNSLVKALRGNEFKHSSSALLIAKHTSDFSNRYAYQMGESVFKFFGQKFLDPKIDVPNSPKSDFDMNDFDKSERLTKKEKKEFLKQTSKTLEKTGLYTRSLLELAKEEFLK